MERTLSISYIYINLCVYYSPPLIHGTSFHFVRFPYILPPTTTESYVPLLEINSLTVILSPTLYSLLWNIYKTSFSKTTPSALSSCTNHTNLLFFLDSLTSRHLHFTILYFNRSLWPGTLHPGISGTT